MTMTSMSRLLCAADVGHGLPAPTFAAEVGHGLPAPAFAAEVGHGLPAAPDTGHVSFRIRRVTTTRAGGVAAPPFDTFNPGDHVGDDPAAVAANRARLAAAIGLGADRLVWMNQAHGDRVEVVDGPRETPVEDTD